MPIMRSDPDVARTFGEFEICRTSSTVGLDGTVPAKFAFTPEPEGLDKLKTPYERLFGSKEVHEEYDRLKRFWQGVDHRPTYAFNGMFNGNTISGGSWNF